MTSSLLRIANSTSRTRQKSTGSSRNAGSTWFFTRRSREAIVCSRRRCAVTGTSRGMPARSAGSSISDPGAEYGKQRDLVKVREQEVGRVVPSDAYGLAKLFCNEDARRRPRVTNLRLFGVYGPQEGYLFRFISNSIVKAILGVDLVVRQDVVFDYLHIDDLVAIVERFIQNGPGVSDVNVTPTESISLRRILAIISSAAGRPLPVAFQTEGLNFQYTGAERGSPSPPAGHPVHALRGRDPPALQSLRRAARSP